MNLKEIINGNYVKSIIKRITNEYNEDLEQEVYLKVWKNSEKYTEQGNLKAWVSTIAANVSKDYLKSSKKKIQQMTIDDDEAVLRVADKKTTPELKLIQIERQKQISEAINSLKPKFKEVIMLSEIQNLTYEEISKKINCPIGTVKSRIYNAKKELAEKLKDLM